MMFKFYRALQKNKGPSYPMDLVVQDDQLSFSYEKPQNPSAKSNLFDKYVNYYTSVLCVRNY